MAGVEDAAEARRDAELALRRSLAGIGGAGLDTGLSGIRTAAVGEGPDGRPEWLAAWGTADGAAFVLKLW